jgi:hypothetical protein
VPLATGPATNPSDPDWAVGPEVDRTPPETSITKSPRRETKRRTATFRFQSNEPGSTFACRLDRRAFGACESPVTYRRLQPGRHRFRVVATDLAANADPSPAQARFRVLRR